MIELYLIRHGIAAERGPAYPDDEKRPLTPRGVARIRREAAALAALDVTFDHILTSRLTRARQTARILASQLAGHPPVSLCDELGPDGSASAVIDELGKYARRTRLAMVGHEPTISALAARLIGARTPVAFKKGAMCRIDVEVLPLAKPGMLRWFATSKMLRWIRKAAQARRGRSVTLTAESRPHRA